MTPSVVVDVSVANGSSSRSITAVGIGFVITAGGALASEADDSRGGVGHPAVTTSPKMSSSSNRAGAPNGLRSSVASNSASPMVFRELLIARIAEPTSKLDSLRVLDDLGAELVSYKTIDRHVVRSMQRAPRCDRRKVLRHARDCGGLSLLLYDVTTLYFEAENEDDLRKVGYSKERRIDPQIVVGLLVDQTGLPLEIGCYEGNTAETTTIAPIITSFLQRHDLHDTPLVVAADAGMLSAANLSALDELGLSFIVGSRTTKAPGDLESHFHWNGDVFTDGQVIDTVTPRHGNTRVNDTALRAEPVWNPDTHPGAWRAIWAYSAERARRTRRPSARKPRSSDRQR